MSEITTSQLLKGLQDSIPLGPHPTPYNEWIQVRLDFVQGSIEHLQASLTPSDPTQDFSRRSEPYQEHMIKYLEEQVTHLEAALLAAFPYGASGAVYEHWNASRLAAPAAPATEPEKTVQEIMEFARHYAANTFSSGTLEDKIRRSLVATAPDELERLRKDAKRYKWLSEYLVSDDESYDDAIIAATAISVAELSYVIDVARDAYPKKGEQA